MSGPPEPGEIDRLKAMPDMLTAMMFQIIEGVAKFQDSEKLNVSGDIMTRFFNEMSNGMLGYNQALQVALLPFPYPCAQLLAWFLTFLFLFCPIMTVCMAPGLLFPSGFSFIVIFAYWSVNETAKVLERPFGDDPCDLPLLETHECFVVAESGRLRPSAVAS